MHLAVHMHVRTVMNNTYPDLMSCLACAHGMQAIRGALVPHQHRQVQDEAFKAWQQLASSLRTHGVLNKVSR